MLSYQIFNLKRNQQITLKDKEEQPDINENKLITESFFHRTDNLLDNLTHSFTSFLINLKQSIEKKYKIDFFKDIILKDLKEYKDFLLKNNKKENIKEFKKEFNKLIDEIDSDLIDTLGIAIFSKKVLNSYDEKDSFDISNKKIDKAFTDYIESLDDKIEKTYKEFVKKVEKNPYYESINDIEIEQSKYTLEEFQKEKYYLQIELLKLQEWVIENNKKVLIIFEGRDASGKGSAIKNLSEYLMPKYKRDEFFGIPSKEESKNWFERYKNRLPFEKEMVFYDRSWYTRGYVEPSLEYCTIDEYKDFLKEVNGFEKELIDDGIILIKIWLSISKNIQKLRFKLRETNPLKYWKYSENDRKVLKKWDEFTHYINEIFRKTNTDNSPWFIIDADDSRRAKIEVFKNIIKKLEENQKEKEKPIEEEKRNIIFLDIDGVMLPYDPDKNVDYHKFFFQKDKWSKNAMENLNKLIKKTDGVVIISSSYRKNKTKAEVQKMFDDVGFEYKIQELLYDVKNEGRGEDMVEFLKKNKNKIKNFVAIDDNLHDFHKFIPFQNVKVKSDKGFTKKNMWDAIEILKDEKHTEKPLRELFKKIIEDKKEKQEDKD